MPKQRKTPHPAKQNFAECGEKLCFYNRRLNVVGVSFRNLVAAFFGLFNIIAAREDDVENDAGNRSNGKGGDLCGCIDRNDYAAERADQDDSRDDEVAALGKVDLVFDEVADTDSGDHTVKDEGNAADDGRRDKLNDSGKFRREGKNDGKDSRNADNSRVVDIAEGQNAGVFCRRSYWQDRRRGKQRWWQSRRQ